MSLFHRRRSRGGITPDEKQSHGQGSSNQSDIDPGAIFRTASGEKIDIFGALDSFRRELKSPGDHQCNGESDRDQRNYQPHDPVWNFQEWKNLRGKLNQEPADNRVGDGNFINVAPLQLGEEALWIHGLACAIQFGSEQGQVILFLS